MLSILAVARNSSYVCMALLCWSHGLEQHPLVFYWLGTTNKHGSAVNCAAKINGLLWVQFHEFFWSSLKSIYLVPILNLLYYFPQFSGSSGIVYSWSSLGFWQSLLLYWSSSNWADGQLKIIRTPYLVRLRPLCVSCNRSVRYSVQHQHRANVRFSIGCIGWVAMSHTFVQVSSMEISTDDTVIISRNRAIFYNLKRAIELK